MLNIKSYEIICSLFKNKYSQEVIDSTNIHFINKDRNLILKEINSKLDTNENNIDIVCDEFMNIFTYYKDKEIYTKLKLSDLGLDDVVNVKIYIRDKIIICIELEFLSNKYTIELSNMELENELIISLKGEIILNFIEEYNYVVDIVKSCFDVDTFLNFTNKYQDLRYENAKRKK